MSGRAGPGRVGSGRVVFFFKCHGSVGPVLKISTAAAAALGLSPRPTRRRWDAIRVFLDWLVVVIFPQGTPSGTRWGEGESGTDVTGGSHVLVALEQHFAHGLGGGNLSLTPGGTPCTLRRLCGMTSMNRTLGQTICRSLPPEDLDLRGADTFLGRRGQIHSRSYQGTIYLVLL